jgi:hypothetical protein
VADLVEGSATRSPSDAQLGRIADMTVLARPRRTSDAGAHPLPEPAPAVVTTGVDMATMSRELASSAKELVTPHRIFLWTATEARWSSIQARLPETSSPQLRLAYSIKTDPQPRAVALRLRGIAEAAVAHEFGNPWAVARGQYYDTGPY